MKTITITLTEEQEKAVREILKEERKGKWVPKEGEEYWTVNNRVNVAKYTNDEDDLDQKNIKQNTAFRTKEQAEAEVLRRESAERRYLPKVGEMYKTIGCDWDSFDEEVWGGDSLDFQNYHNGMVWNQETPDSEILAWVEKYRKAWETM